jgi:hypothetical protein
MVERRSYERKYSDGRSNHRFFLCPGCPAHPWLLDNPFFTLAISCSFPKIFTIHDLHQGAVAGSLERESPDTGDIFPGMAFMERCNETKSLETAGQETGGGTMTEKVCPFDKKPCIRERCAVYREESGVCAFLLTGRRGSGHSSSEKSEGNDRSSGKFKAHLFD